MERISAFCIAVLVSLSVLPTQELRAESNSLSLEQIVELALKHNPTFDAVRSQEALAAGEVRQSGLWENPALIVETEEWPLEESFEAARYKLGIAQSFPFPGKKRLERQAATSALAEAQQMQRAKRAALIAEVRKRFYRTLYAENVVTIGQTLRDVARASMQTAEARVDAGEANEQEALRAEIQFERVQSDLSEHQRSYFAARSELARVLGGSIPDGVEVQGELVESASSRLLNFEKMNGLEDHPLLLAADERIAVARARLARAELEPYPDITFSLAGGRRERSEETLVDFGVTMPLPLFDRAKGTKAAARAALQRAEAERRAVAQTLRARLAQALHAVRTLNSEVRTFRSELLPRADRALAMVQTGFREGQFSFNDLLDTQRTTAESRLLYQRKLFELNRAIVEAEELLFLDTQYPLNVLKE